MLSFLVGLLAVAGLAVEQVATPSRVAWQPAPLPGCPGERAEGLVLQQQDGDTVWASEGYEIYRSDGGPFVRIAGVRPPMGEAWGGYFRFLRKLYGYQELMEVVPLKGDLLLVFAGGAV